MDYEVLDGGANAILPNGHTSLLWSAGYAEGDKAALAGKAQEAAARAYLRGLPLQRWEKTWVGRGFREGYGLRLRIMCEQPSTPRATREQQP